MTDGATSQGATFGEALASHLPGWLERQRWFGAKGREVSGVEVASATSLTDAEPLLDLLVLAVSFADGGPVFELRRWFG